MAHNRPVNLVSNPSCEGTLPLRLLPLRNLREGAVERDEVGQRGSSRRAAHVSPTRRRPPRPKASYGPRCRPMLVAQGRGSGAHREVPL